MAAVINATDWFISADCGVMHLSAATDTATIGLFKGTDPGLYEPYGMENTALQVEEGNPDRTIARIAQKIAAVFAKRRRASA